MAKMNPVVHFEIPAEDKKRMTDFYSKAFGWGMQQLGEEMGNYILVTTTETGSNGMPKNPGAINGGFYEKSDDNPIKHPSIVIAVDDINESIEKVKKAGGKINGEPMEIPGTGIYISFVDTEGNYLSMLQPLENM